MSTTATSSLELKMNSATKVGEIFTKAGDSYNKIGDMLVMLHPAASELIALEEANQQKMLAFEQQQQQLQQQLLAAQQQQGVATITLQQPQQQHQQPQQQTVQQPTATRTTVTPAPQYISIGGHTVRVINGTVAIPAGGIAGIQAGQTLQLSDGTLIKTEPAQSIIQSHDVSALLDAAVSQTDAGSGGGSAQQSFIKFEDTPVVANEEEIGQVL